LQKKLNRLIDDGIVRPGELDNMTLDALEGEGRLGYAHILHTQMQALGFDVDEAP
jgi:hypothetical protein